MTRRQLTRCITFRGTKVHLATPGDIFRTLCNSEVWVLEEAGNLDWFQSREPCKVCIAQERHLPALATVSDAALLRIQVRLLQARSDQALAEVLDQGGTLEQVEHEVTVIERSTASILAWPR